MMLKFDGTVTMGNILTVVSMAIIAIRAMQQFWKKVDGRMGDLETTLKIHASTIAVHTGRLDAHEGRMLQVINDLQKWIGISELAVRSRTSDPQSKKRRSGDESS